MYIGEGMIEGMIAGIILGIILGIIIVKRGGTIRKILWTIGGLGVIPGIALIVKGYWVVSNTYVIWGLLPHIPHL